MRSMLRLSNPACLAACTAAAASSAECRLPSRRSSLSSSDCTPMLSRFDAGAAYRREPLAGAIAGVRFERGLRVGRQVERTRDGAHQPSDVAGGQVRWCAAAEEEAREPGPAEPRAPLREVVAQRVDVARHQRLDARVRVEVAVGAARLAERDVDVQGDRLAHLRIIACGRVRPRSRDRMGRGGRKGTRPDAARRPRHGFLQGVVGEPCADQPIQANAFLGGPYGKGAMRFRGYAHHEFPAVGAVGHGFWRRFIVGLHIRDAVLDQHPDSGKGLFLGRRQPA